MHRGAAIHVTALVQFALTLKKLFFHGVQCGTRVRNRPDWLHYVSLHVETCALPLKRLRRRRGLSGSQMQVKPRLIQQFLSFETRLHCLIHPRAWSLICRDMKAYIAEKLVGPVS
jgi:hypothetical protein